MHDENGLELLCITSNDCGKMCILEKVMCLSSGLYAIAIWVIESRDVIQMTSWVLTHNGFAKTDGYIPVIIWWSVYWKPHTDIYSIELFEAWINGRFKEMRQQRKEKSFGCRTSGDRLPMCGRPVDPHPERTIDRLRFPIDRSTFGQSRNWSRHRPVKDFADRSPNFQRAVSTGRRPPSTGRPRDDCFLSLWCDQILLV